MLVVDEAGMAATRQLAELLEHVEQADGKLVLVGDHRQLPEIEAGGAFRALVARGLAVELVHNQRQAEPWERRALDHVADGRAAEAVAAYQQHGRIHTAPTADQTRTRLVEDWWQASKTGEDAIILAHRRTDVAQLNQLARNAMRAAGRLRGPELQLPGGAFAAGDLVVIKRNDHQHGVANGDRGTITHVDPDHQRLTIRSTTAKSSSTAASSTTPPARAAPRSSTATRSPATSPKASPPTPPSCSPTPA